MLKHLIRQATQAGQAVKAAAGTTATAPGFIDVRRLIRELSDEELLASADAYFAGLTPASEQCRKPWGNPEGALHQTRHLGLVLQAADLFRGARVLDFGCATGWLSIGLSLMGCHAVGVDISAHALALAEGQKAARPPARGAGTLEFLRYDGRRLPLDDASVDRVLCFDAFHHVRDPDATIAEFARVLRPGGRAAFCEPGPEHSRTPASQAEMARYKVIENDVRMDEVAAAARRAGLAAPQLLIQLPRAVEVGCEDYLRWTRQGLDRAAQARLLQELQRELGNEQVFYIDKPAPDGVRSDSRRPEGLAARLTLVRAERVPHPKGGDGVALVVDAVNTGSARWLDAKGPGQVNLGLQVLEASGAMREPSHARVALPSGPVEPGGRVRFEAVVRRPAGEPWQLQLDLVSELVAWFGLRGTTQPIRLGSDRV